MWWEIKNHLENKNGELCIGKKSVSAICSEFSAEHVPIFVYDLGRIRENFRIFKKAVSRTSHLKTRVHYAMKANSNEAVLEALLKEGAGIDAVSPKEVELAVRVGFASENILFSGVSSSENDLARVVKQGACVNADSLVQLQTLHRLKKMHALESVSVRVDPGVPGAGHSWSTITAGRYSDHDGHLVPIKFGIPKDRVLHAFEWAKRFGLNPRGIQFHIGSGWKTKQAVNEFLLALDKVLELSNRIVQKREIELDFIDVGGGPGIPYRKTDSVFPLDYYAREISKRLETHSFGEIKFEPGRFIVGDAGLLLTQVTDVKNRYSDLIVGINSGFNQLDRPARYGAFHEIVVANDLQRKPLVKTTVVGNLCETGDILTPQPRLLPRLKPGDILAFHNAGAYGFSMASQYNLREWPLEIAVENKKIKNVFSHAMVSKKKRR